MILLLVLLSFNFAAPGEIDYTHRVFSRELQSVFSSSTDKISRLAIPGTYDSDVSGRYFTVGEDKGFAYIGRVNSCRSGGCSHASAPGGMSNLAAEYFDYFILFDTDARVKSVRVFNYQATHGHGIMSRGWLRQFNGFRGEKKLEPGKNVDAISGATISVQSIIADIELRTKLLSDIIRR